MGSRFCSILGLQDAPKTLQLSRQSPPRVILVSTNRLVGRNPFPASTACLICGHTRAGALGGIASAGSRNRCPLHDARVPAFMPQNAGATDAVNMKKFGAPNAPGASAELRPRAQLPLLFGEATRHIWPGDTAHRLRMPL